MFILLLVKTFPAVEKNLSESTDPLGQLIVSSAIWAISGNTVLCSFQYVKGSRSSSRGAVQKASNTASTFASATGFQISCFLLFLLSYYD